MREPEVLPTIEPFLAPSRAETLSHAIMRNVREALAEDYGPVDLTGSLVPAAQEAKARVVAKEAAVVCGAPWFDACVLALDPAARITWHVAEGGMTGRGAAVCTIEAKARAILAAERSALNFLQTLSATASNTSAFVSAIHGLSPNPKGCRILDTRKTMPGMRQAQKYAVRMGGGTNHRMGLWDGILIKENHIAACGGIASALAHARDLDAGVPIHIEVEDLSELAQALQNGAQCVLLDDFSLADMRQGFELAGGRAVLEVSGGVSLRTVRDIAATGVDRISVGSLTKNVAAVDFSLRLE